MSRFLFSTASFCAGPLLLLCGCSEMKFVNATSPSAATHDPRRDIHLTGVVAEMSSGTALLRRVAGEKAVYSQDRGVIQLENARVEGFRTDGRLQGATRADKAVVYLADQPTSVAMRRDMEFAGRVRHRTPAESDPTTDAQRLETERLVWSEAEKRFRGPVAFRMVSAVAGKPPMVLSGTQFMATRDLQSFTIGGGFISSELHNDIRSSVSAAGSELARLVEQMDRNNPRGPLPQPIVIPKEAEGFPARSIVEHAEKLKAPASAP